MGSWDQPWDRGPDTKTATTTSGDLWSTLSRMLPMANAGQQTGGLLELQGGPPISFGGSGGGVNPLATTSAAARNARFVGLHPAISANPFVQGAAGAIGEYAAQGLEGTNDPGAIGLAAAVPPVLAGGLRLARGVERTATRLVPGLFNRAHEAAQGSGRELLETLAPPGLGSRLMEEAATAAQGAGDIPTPHSGSLVERLTRQLGLTPSLSPAGDKLRVLVNNAAELSSGRPLPLSTVDAYLKEANRAIPGAPKEAMALAGSLVGDIETAAGAGGVEASLLRSAAEAYKRQLGAERLGELVKSATREGAIGQTPALDIAKLSNLVRKDPDVTRLLGPDGMRQVQAFLQEYRGLPPVHGATAVTSLLASLAGVAGATSGLGMPGSLLAAGVPELLRNTFAVKGNAPGMNRALSAVGQAGRVAITDPYQDRNPFRR